MESKFPSCYLEGPLGFKSPNSPFSHSFAAGDSIQKAIDFGKPPLFVGLALVGKDIVFRITIEYIAA
jgi:hypothetical protein